MRLLTEEQKHWVEVIGDFCKKEIEPIMLDWDKVVDPSKAIPFEPYAKAFKLGLNSFEIPKEYGGNKVDLATAEVMYEEMGYYDGNFASVMQTTNLALKPILIGGTPEQVQYFSKHILEGKGYAAFALTEPQSGSDASNVKTTAVKDGDEWVINGEKCFITNGNVADTFVIIAVTGKITDKRGRSMKEISAFIVEKDDKGFSQGKHEKKMGIRGSSTCDLIFEDCVIPKDRMLGKKGEGFKIAMKTLDGGRIGIASQALGIAQGAFDVTVEYMQARKQFGKKLSQFQALQFEMADLKTRIEAARLLVYRAADMKDKHLNYGEAAAMAKLYAAETAMAVTTKCVQYHGGYGYTKDYPVERMMRDAKITEIYEGTSEVQKIVIAGQIFK